MTFSDLLTPWLLLAAVLIPFIFAEKWIHSHLYGVGWLLTNDYKSATALYYLILLPGVFVHEFVQWLVAGALNVPTKRVMAWPEAQKDGTLRLDFVQIRKADWVKSAIIGAAPLIVGVTIVWYISNRILNLEAFLAALGTGEMAAIGSTIQDLGRTADFYLWLYLMFAISNAMIPTPSDRKGWPLLIGIFAVCMVFLVLIGVGDVLMETFTGPVAHTVNLLTTALATVLVVELIAILSIGFFEEILERTTHRKFVYSAPTPARHPETRQPGSNLPLPPGVPMPSIYNLKLPVPDPSIQSSLAAKAKRRAAASLRAEPTAEISGRPSSTEERPLPAGPVPARSRPESVGPSRTPSVAEEPSPGFRRPSAAPLERPGAQTPGGPSRVPPGDVDEETSNEERPSGFRRPSAAPPERPGTFSRPGAPTPGPSRTPLERPGAPTLGPSRIPPREADEEQPSGFRRPSAAPPDRPSAFSRPGAPTLGPSRVPPRAADEEDEVTNDDRPSGSRRPAATPPERPGAFSSPTTSAFRHLPNEEDEIDDEDEISDEEQPTGLRRPLLGVPGRNMSPTKEDDFDDDEDEEDEDIEYIDFDDL